MQKESFGYLQLIIYALLAGSVGIFVKGTSGLDAGQLLFFRGFIASFFLLLAVLLLGKIGSLKIIDAKRTLFIGIAEALSIFFYFSSMLQTTVSNSMFLAIATAPAFALILAKIFLKERIEKRTIISTAIVITGIILLLNPAEFSFDSSKTIGNIFALLSGLLYASMVVASKPLLEKVSGHYVVFWQYLIACVLFIPAIILMPLKIGAISQNLFQLLMIGVACTGIAFVFLMEGLKKIKAQKVFLITSLETMTGTALAVLLLGEQISLLSIAGAVLILFGIYRTAKSAGN